jgi:hypothetical protein
LGGEEALILMLKDKSPTRGVHMCYGMEKVLGFKPWLMGQPIRRSLYTTNHNNSTPTSTTTTSPSMITTATTTTTTASNSKNGKGDDDADNINSYNHYNNDRLEEDDDANNRTGTEQQLLPPLHPPPPPRRLSVVERVTAALSPTPRPHPRFIVPQQQQQQQPTTTTTTAALGNTHMNNSNIWIIPPSPPNTAVTTTMTTKMMATTTTRTKTVSTNNNNNNNNSGNHNMNHHTTSTYYRVYWTSPFFIQCKFGVLQYVLIKLFCAMATLILEYNDWYQEGSFQYTSGYLYICILTNVSQCYALYCLIFFYYATKNELSPIRPVGKFISVKAIVFFTWWQSVLISGLYQMDLIPNYKASNTEKNWNSEDVAKGIQDYLICIEMFIAAIVHSVVFPHSEYTISAVRARDHATTSQLYHHNYNNGSTNQNGTYNHYRANLDGSGRIHTKRLGRRRNRYHQHQHHPMSMYHPTRTTTAMTGDDPISYHHPLSDQSLSTTHSSMVNLVQGDVELSGISAVAACTTSIGGGGGGVIHNNTSNDDDDDDRDHHTMESNDTDDNSFGTWESKESNHGMLLYPARHVAVSSSLQPMRPAKQLPFRPPLYHSDSDDEKYLVDVEQPQPHHSPPLKLEGSMVVRTQPVSQPSSMSSTPTNRPNQQQDPNKPGLFRAFIDSAIPRDLHDNTVDLLLQRGDFLAGTKKKTTLLHHAATSDQYDLFAKNSIAKASRRYNNNNSSTVQQQQQQETVSFAAAAAAPAATSTPTISNTKGKGTTPN